MTVAEAHIESWLESHIREVVARPTPPAPGQSNTARNGSTVTRVGRFPLPDGRYFADAAYRVEEGYDDDWGSRTCRRGCPFAAQAHVHVHRVAGTLAGLLDAQTAPHMARPNL